MRPVCPPRVPRVLARLAPLACIALLAAACEGTKSDDAAHGQGAGQPGAPEHATDAGTGTTEAAGTAAPSAWDGMSHEQRAELMKREVLPKMRAAFAAVEPDEFSKMNCATCHGAGAKDKTFKMPNPRLPKLPAASNPAGWAKLQAEEPEMLELMKTKVVPGMAAILGEKPYDPATHEGFGCFACHTAEE